MKKFQFNLQSVLNVRKREVDEKLSDFARVAGLVNRLKSEIDENTRGIYQQLRRYDTAAKPGGNLNNLRVYESYIKSLQIKNENLNQKIQSQQQALEEARQNLIEARKNAEVIELIKQKKENQYKERAMRSERMEEEENNQMLHHRKKIAAEEQQDMKHLNYYGKDQEPEWQPEEKSKSEYEKLEEFANSLHKKR